MGRNIGNMHFSVINALGSIICCLLHYDNSWDVERGDVSNQSTVITTGKKANSFLSIKGTAKGHHPNFHSAINGGVMHTY